MNPKKLSAEIWPQVLGPIADSACGWDATQCQQLTDAVMAHARRCVRLPPQMEATQLPFATTSVPWWPHGRFLCDSTIRPGAWLQFVAGDYAIQDAASLLPLALLPPRMFTEPAGMRVCDLCAAPGGKSLALLEQMSGQGWLLSNEVIASRVDTLQLTLARSGYDNYVITNQPVERLAEHFGDQFDCVLVDAPCSGQSLVSRDKQALSAFSPRQIEHSAARQQTILKAAVRMVRPGGRLIYSTCTFSFAENEAVVDWLRGEDPDWVSVIEPRLDQWQSSVSPGCYRLWPHRDECHGGFAAALERPLDSHDSIIMSEYSVEPTRQAAQARSQRKPQRARTATVAWRAVEPSKLDCQWGHYATTDPLWQRGNVLSWFAPTMPEQWRSLAHVGIEVAAAFGEHWQPSYPLATLKPACTWFQPDRRVELSDQQAMSYMAGLSLPHSGHPGWCIAQWRGRPLGWAKQVDTQLKNHLPKPLRQNSLKHF